MKEFVCDVCGSTEIVKRDSNFVCQHCGMKYTVDEIRRMMLNEPEKESDCDGAADCTSKENVPFEDSNVSIVKSDLEKNDDDRLKSKNKKMRRIVILAVVAVVVVAFISIKFIVPASEYNNAMDLMEAGKYTDAYELFDKLGDYKDSQSQKAVALEYIKKEQLEKCKTGDVIFVGNNYWIVLDRKEMSSGESRIFLIAKDCVATGDYGSSSSSPTWENSSVRKWLNDTFIKGFSAREKGQIMVTKVENTGNLEYGIEGSAATYDRLFLPSIEEVEDFMFSSEERKANYQGDDVWWWLRSPGKKSKYVSYIWNGGKINNVGLQAETIYTMGIRPAMIMTVGGESGSENVAKVSSFSKHTTREKAIDYKSCFKGTLKQLKNEISGSYAYAEYTLWDINGDSIPELIAHIGTSEADAEFRIYRCDSGKSVLAGTVPGGHSYLAGLDNEKAIIVVYGQMGYEAVNKVAMSKNGLNESLCYERELPPEEDYADFVSMGMNSLLSDSKLSWISNNRTGNDSVLQSVY